MAPHENTFLRSIGRSLFNQMTDDSLDQYTKRIGELMETLQLKNLVLHDSTKSAFDGPLPARHKAKGSRTH